MAAPVWSLPPGPESAVFKPSGRLIIARYLVPRALALRGDTTTVPGHVADGVDVFSARSPAALPFHRSSSRRDHGEVWGYYYGFYPIDGVRPVPGGCWVRYGPEKVYVDVHGRGGAMEAVAFRRRFAFHATWRGNDGRIHGVQTPWLMKEYRLNKGAAAFRAAQACPGVNMDCVVRKVFGRLPPPPPRRSEEEEVTSAPSCTGGEEAGYCSDEDPKSESARKRARF